MVSRSGNVRELENVIERTIYLSTEDKITGAELPSHLRAVVEPGYLLAPHAAPHFREITEVFYGRLAEHESARRVFSGPEQVERLKQPCAAG